VQFDQKILRSILVKKKLSFMAACAFAMEAVTAECASFIDRGFEDYMLDTAMLRCGSTESCGRSATTWKKLQIHGGLCVLH